MMMRRLQLAGALLCALSTLPAQTLIDLKTQVKRVDFGDAISTRPAKTGADLPPLCNTGEVFFLTSAAAGSNLWGCVATNTWMSQGSSAAPAEPGVAAPHLHVRTDIVDCRVVRTSATVLTIQGCRISRANADPVDINNATITYAGGTGILYIHGTVSGSIGVVHTGTLAISCAGCTDYGVATAFPDQVQRVWEWGATDPGSWNSAGIDRRVPAVPSAVTPGLGIAATTTVGGQQLGVDTALIPTLSSEQAGQMLVCNGSASATASTCSMMPVMTGYAAGMQIRWKSGATNTGALTLNIDNIGAKPVRQSDGTTDPVPFSIRSGEYRNLIYDGSAFRLLSGNNGTQVVGAAPASPLGTGAVAYCAPMGAACGTAVNSIHDLRWPAAGVISDVSVLITTAQAGGSLVCSAYINGSASTATVTVPSGSAAGNFTGTGAAVFSAGDKLALHCVNNSATTPVSVAVVSQRITY